MGTTPNGASRIQEARDHKDRRAGALARHAHTGSARHPRRTFYRWYDRFLEGGAEALEDRPSAPSRVWNPLSAGIHDRITSPAYVVIKAAPNTSPDTSGDVQRHPESLTDIIPLLSDIYLMLGDI